MKYSHFQKGGVITCQDCGHKTRETGKNETGLQLCKKCIAAGEWANAILDGTSNLEDVPAKLLSRVKLILGL